MNVAAKEIPLMRKGHRLVLDVAEDVFRLAYYYPRKSYNEQTQTWTTKEARLAIKHKQLEEGLRVLFAEADSDLDERVIVHYIRSTPWGRELPGG